MINFRPIYQTHESNDNFPDDYVCSGGGTIRQVTANRQQMPQNVIRLSNNKYFDTDTGRTITGPYYFQTYNKKVFFEGTLLACKTFVENYFNKLYKNDNRLVDYVQYALSNKTMGYFSSDLFTPLGEEVMKKVKEFVGNTGKCRGANKKGMWLKWFNRDKLVEIQVLRDFLIEMGLQVELILEKSKSKKVKHKYVILRIQ